MKANWIIGTFLLLLMPLWIGAQNDVQNYRPYDQRGLNVFETPKSQEGSFDGFKVRLGGNFTQQFQALDHENTADFVDANGDGVTNFSDLQVILSAWGGC